MNIQSEQRGSEQRAAVRFDTHLPIRIDGAHGVAHNISNTGIYFETDVQQSPGQLVNVMVEYTLQGRKRQLVCEGKVLRVHRQDGRVGVAARLLSPFFAQGRGTAAATA
jgi:acyl-coenzyme A thioesterase PaaI-like protein